MSVELLRDMIAAGVDPELVARVAELVGKVKALESRRASDAERKRKSRLSHVTSRDVRDNCDIQDVIPVHILPPKKEQTSEAKKPPTSVGTRLPADWCLAGEYLDFAMAEGMTTAEANAEADRFRDYWHARPGAGARKTNWLATWRNWIRDHNERRKTGPPHINGHAAAPRPGSREDTRERTVNALDKLREYNRSHADDTSPGGGPDREISGLLPFPKPSQS